MNSTGCSEIKVKVNASKFTIIRTVEFGKRRNLIREGEKLKPRWRVS